MKPVSPSVFYSDTAYWLAGGQCAGIYVIINARSHYVYIGSSKHIARRVREHFIALSSQKHPSKHLQRAWNKYGSSSFKAHVIEIVTDADLLRTREQAYLDSVPATAIYNSSRKATGGLSSQTPESNLKRSLSLKGRKKKTTRSPEAIAKWREKVIGQTRKPLSGAHKRLLSERLKGRIPSVQEREKQRLAVNAPEYRANARARLLGIPKPLEMRQKISATLRNKKKFNQPLQPVLLSATPPDRIEFVEQAEGQPS